MSGLDRSQVDPVAPLFIGATLRLDYLAFIETKGMDKRILSFLGMAYGISWGTVGVAYGLGVRDVSHPAYVVVAALCMIGPAVAAVMQQRLLDRDSWEGLGLIVKGTNWRVLARTAFIGMCIVPVYFLMQHLLGAVFGIVDFGQVSITTERMMTSIAETLAAVGQEGGATGRFGFLENYPAGLVLIGALLAAVLSAFTFNLPFMLGEELGWRGYLYQRTSHWSGLRRIGLTGVMWGLWHAPLIAMGHNYPEFRIAGIGMMVLFCLVLSVLFDWTRSRSGSIWSACILHGIINGSAGATVLFAYGGHPLLASVVGLAGMSAIALLGVCVLLFDRRYGASLLAPQQEESA